MILVCSGEVIFNFVFISGLWKREIVIYSISTGGLTIFIFVCMVLLQRYKKRNGRKGPDNTMVAIQHSNVELEDTSIDQVEALYETIDETNMLDTPIELMNPDEGGMPSFISDSPINGGVQFNT